MSRAQTIEMTILVLLSLLGFFVSYYFMGYAGIIVFPVASYIVGKYFDSVNGLMPLLLLLLPFTQLAQAFGVKIM